MSLYDRLKSTAAAKIKKYGAEYEFTRTTFGAVDYSSGTVSSTESTYTAFAVREEFTASERADSSIEVGDIKLLAAAASYAINDKVVIDGEPYKLVSVKPIKPGSIAVAYELQARK